MDTIRHILELKGPVIWTISPDETVFEALRIMAAKDVGALVVMKGEKMVGVISERDYARKIILHGKHSQDTYVHEIMVTDIVTVHPDQTVEEAMELMTNKRVRHLPVMEGDEILGIISIGDVVNNIIRRQRKTISQLESKVKKPVEKPFEPAVPRFHKPQKKK
jgi:signal-transduction protein with cAMP-binding, CBS, and nucleotidyltransferase domain